MREIKIDSTKREAAEEIMDLLCFKLEHNNESVIGISIDGETGEISTGFTCYNDTPEIELIGQHDDEGMFGDVPPFENWTEKDKNDIVEYIEDVFFKEIYDENENENIYITFNGE